MEGVDIKANVLADKNKYWSNILNYLNYLSYITNLFDLNKSVFVFVGLVDDFFKC